MTLRILYLIETLGHGGAEHQLVANLQRLDRRRFEPIVGYFRKPDYLARQLASVNVELHNCFLETASRRDTNVFRA